MAAASWWERIRSLDWLALFIASWVVPFILDYAVGLTYFTSLTFWLAPTLLLLPRFLEFTDGGGRRRSAMWLTTGAIVGLGVLLDCVFGRRILQFDESPNATYIGWLSLPALGVHVPYRGVPVLRDDAAGGALDLRMGERVPGSRSILRGTIGRPCHPVSSASRCEASSSRR